MWSLARIPGKRLVMPRSSRTGTPSGPLTPSILGRCAGAGLSTRPRILRLRDFRRRLDLAGDDLLGDLGDRRLLRGRHRAIAAAELSERDPAVLEAVDGVTAALVLGGLRSLDREVHGLVDLLPRARQHLRAEEALVVVDADAAHTLRLGRLDRAQTAAAGDLEDHARTLADLAEGDLLALRLVPEVLRVGVEGLRARDRLLRSRLVAGDEPVDGRQLDPTDGADYAALALGLQGGEVPSQVPDL